MGNFKKLVGTFFLSSIIVALFFIATNCDTIRFPLNPAPIAIMCVVYIGSLFLIFDKDENIEEGEENEYY